jgi:hypothetical protein
MRQRLVAAEHTVKERKNRNNTPRSTVSTCFICARQIQSLLWQILLRTPHGEQLLHSLNMRILRCMGIDTSWQ